MSFAGVAAPLALACSVTTTPITSGPSAGDGADAGTSTADGSPSPPDAGGGAPEASAAEGSVPRSDSGLQDASSNDASPPSQAKRVFFTSRAFSGDLKTQGQGNDGLSGADNLCNAAASAAGLGGAWRAWISVNHTSNAEDRIADVGPWYLIDRTTLVFANKQAFAKPPVHAIDLDETGGGPGPDRFVWTGTYQNIAFKGDDCAGWTSATSASSGVTGEVGLGAPGPNGWTDLTTSSCDSPLSLYCFEQ